MNRWLKIADAAKRVGRSERTIRRWIENGDIALHMGRLRESDLIEAEQLARSRVGRPRKKASS